MENPETKYVLKLFIETPNAKNNHKYHYEFQHGRNFQPYSGILGKLGLEKVNKPSAFHFGHHLFRTETYPELIEKIKDKYLDTNPYDGVSKPFNELHIYELNNPFKKIFISFKMNSLEYDLKMAIPEIKIAGRNRKMAFDLEETFRLSQEIGKKLEGNS